MQEPILEALTFRYEGIRISDAESGEDNANGNSISAITQQLNECLQRFNTKFTTPCPFKSCTFHLDGLMDPLCENFNITQEFLKHFLLYHNLVLDNVASIANLHLYLVYWGEVFAQENFALEDVCVAFWMDKPMTSVEGVQKNSLPPAESGSSQSETRCKYYMLSDVVPQDKALRVRLWSERLESVLEINHLERKQIDFSYKCPILCKEVCVGNRANLFLHMAQEHGFHVGQPDNIVFVKEFLELVEKQLESLKCICCEKTFKDRTILKEHMRKKQHKRINPLNPEYDRFYMINYLEVGKTWQALELEDVDEERIEEDWTELKDETNQIICLICPKQLDNFEDTLRHMTTDHSFDFNTVTCKYNFYQKVKIVNFIRRNVYRSLCFYCESKFTEDTLEAHIKQHSSNDFPAKKIWDQAELLFPTYENDQLLMFLTDEDDSESAAMETDSKEDGENPLIIPEDLQDIKIPPVIQPPPDLDLDEF